MYRCPSTGYGDIKGSRGLALNIPNLRDTWTQVVNVMPLLLDPWHKASSIHLRGGGWVRYRASLDILRREKSHAPARNKTMIPWLSSP
jgi:hypothetical protein